MHKSHLKNQTPSTPAIPHLYALDAQLDDMLAEGMEHRFARHARMAKIVQSWAQKHFGIFPEEGYWSPTLTCVNNTKEIDVADLIGTLADEYNLRIANGYGDIKGKTFRIAHMGDTQVDEIEGLLRVIESALGL
jgi:aspartate aminotransferase-like enzyme